MTEAEAIAKLKDAERFPQANRPLAQAFAALADQISKQPEGRWREYSLNHLARAYEGAASTVAPINAPPTPQRRPTPAPTPAPAPARPAGPAPRQPQRPRR